jgi:hypothetical protein
MNKDEPMFPAMQSTGQLKKDIWNEALEEASKQFVDSYRYYGYDVDKIIKSLRK